MRTVKKVLTVSLQFCVLLASTVLYQNCSTPVSHGNASLSSSSTSLGSSQAACTSSTTPGELTGNVTDATTRGILSGVTVEVFASGSSTVLNTTTTDSAGNYSFPNLAPGNYVLSFSKTGYITYSQTSADTITCGLTLAENAALSPNLVGGQMRIVLAWTAAPANWSSMMSTYETTVMDMDSYLLVPGYSEPIYWNNCDDKPAVGSVPGCTVSGAYLNVDQIDWSGPETITITTQATGTYTYYIANYSDPCNSMGLANSKVTVTVYSGNSILKQYNLNPGSPLGTSGLVYEVFTMNNGQLSDVLKYNDSLPVELIQNASVANGLCDQETNL